MAKTSTSLHSSNTTSASCRRYCRHPWAPPLSCPYQFGSASGRHISLPSSAPALRRMLCARKPASRVWAVGDGDGLEQPAALTKSGPLHAFSVDTGRRRVKSVREPSWQSFCEAHSGVWTGTRVQYSPVTGEVQPCGLQDVSPGASTLSSLRLAYKQYTYCADAPGQADLHGTSPMAEAQGSESLGAVAAADAGASQPDPADDGASLAAPSSTGRGSPSVPRQPVPLAGPGRTGGTVQGSAGSGHAGPRQALTWRQYSSTSPAVWLQPRVRGTVGGGSMVDDAESDGTDNKAGSTGDTAVAGADGASGSSRTANSTGSGMQGGNVSPALPAPSSSSDDSGDASSPETSTLKPQPGFVWFSSGAYSNGPASIVPPRPEGKEGRVHSSARAQYEVEQCLVAGQGRLRMAATVAVEDSGPPAGSEGRDAGGDEAARQLLLRVLQVCVTQERRAAGQDVASGSSFEEAGTASLLSLRSCTQQVREYVRSSEQYARITSSRTAPSSSSRSKRRVSPTLSYSSASDSEGEGASGLEAAALLAGETSWPVHVTVAYAHQQQQQQQQQQGQQQQQQARPEERQPQQQTPNAASRSSSTCIGVQSSGLSYVAFADEHQRVQFGEGGRTMRQLGFSLRNQQASEPSGKLAYSEVFVVSDEPSALQCGPPADDQPSEGQALGKGQGKRQDPGLLTPPPVIEGLPGSSDSNRGKETAMEGEPSYGIDDGGLYDGWSTLGQAGSVTTQEDNDSSQMEGGDGDEFLTGEELRLGALWADGEEGDVGEEDEGEGSYYVPRRRYLPASRVGRAGGSTSSRGGHGGQAWCSVAGGAGRAGSTAFAAAGQQSASEEAVPVFPGDFTVGFNLELYDDWVEDREILGALPGQGAVLNVNAQATQHKGPETPVAAGMATAKQSSGSDRDSVLDTNASFDVDVWGISPKGYVLSLNWVLWDGGEVTLKRKYNAAGQLVGVYQYVYPPLRSVLPL